MAGKSANAANSNHVVVPNRLRQLRDARGLTRRQMAIEFDVTETSWFRWETARQAIPDERKEQLARYFGVSVCHLMMWPADKPPPERKS
jgi:transcriptional regulator with XRE-family HTH domain